MNRLHKQAKRLTPGVLVRVSWIDADQGQGAWCGREEALSQAPTIVTSVGVVVGTRNGLLVLAGDTDGFNIHQVGRIPLSCLRSIQQITSATQ